MQVKLTWAVASKAMREKKNLLDSTASSGESPVSHHGAISGATVFFVLVFFHEVNSVQSDYWTVWINLPRRAIQSRLDVSPSGHGVDDWLSSSSAYPLELGEA